MKFNLFNRGIGVTRSPYRGYPIVQSHYGFNFGYNRMQWSCDVYAFGLLIWVVW